MTNELKHYGVPGMRWGRRKGSTKKSSGSKRISRGKKAVGIALGVLGTATVATLATAAVTRGMAMKNTILGMGKGYISEH